MRILVVDDNASSADLIARALRKRGDNITALYNGQSAIDFIQHEPVDLILTDWNMDPVGGASVLSAARAHSPPIEVIIFTGYGAVEIAVDAMRLGARDFLTKPVTIGQLALRIDALAAEKDTSTRPSTPPSEFVAIAPQSKALFAQIQRAATAPSHVWIEGEIGSGRGHVAATLHAMSTPDRPFTIIDPYRLDRTPPPTTGTALIPNLDDLPDDVLRNNFHYVQSLPREVRVIITSTSHMTQNAHLAWQQLYYAVAVITLVVPALRERREDIIPLFLKQAKVAYDTFGVRPIGEISADEQQLLLQHNWPGNLRELFNLAERTVVMGPETLHSTLSTPARATKPAISSTAFPSLHDGFDLAKFLEDIERDVLVEALRIANGNRRVAGTMLNVERNTLRYKLRKYDLWQED